MSLFDLSGNKREDPPAITPEQIERLYSQLPEDIHVMFGTLPVTDEDIDAAIEDSKIVLAHRASLATA